MKIVSVLTEFGNRSLDREFSYIYNGTRRLEEKFRVQIDFGGKKALGLVTSVRETSKTIGELEEENGYRLKEIPEYYVIDEEPLISEKLMRLAQEVASYYVSPLITVIQSMLPLSLAPRSSALNGPKKAYDLFVEGISFSEDELTARQIEMLRLLKRSGPLLKKEAGSPSIIKKLEEKKLVRVFKRERNRLEIPLSEREEPHELNVSQEKALRDIVSSRQEVVLLQGITGSGKTEVYLHLAEMALEEGKDVLFLVPEINLTPRMVEYCTRRFGGQVAILHSGLTNGEKYDEYRRIAKGEAHIVVGARSAVFAPLGKLGLIILDEEHVESYKQDAVPFYHAREVAIMRGKLEGAKVLLGSATPSLETKARAMKGVYGYAEMKERALGTPLPTVEIVDLTERENKSSLTSKLSVPLINMIKDALSNGKQAILLLNRRGYWTGVNCPSCGHIFTCPSCNGNLTYHKDDSLLKCHHCGHVELYPERCPECGNEKLRRVGYGTERLEKDIKDVFTGAKVLRIDSDVAKSAAKLEKDLRDFRYGKYDILVGTQMVSKGHDFPKVSVSAVVLADIGLAMPTYRASERTFELICQAVGRSGRSIEPGKALIQTYLPAHYAIRFGALQDYEGFYKAEMLERKVAQYPPFVYMFLLELRAKNPERLMEAAIAFKNEIDNASLTGVRAIGPITPYYSMIGEKHRKTILVKCKNRAETATYLGNLAKDHAGKGGIDVIINADPLDY